MTDTIRAAQNDLAFMKAIAEDRGALPPILGAHLLAVGLPFGLNVIYAWAGISGFVPSPDQPRDWMIWAWAPAAAIYLLAVIFISLRSRGVTLGPAARAFAAAWTAVTLMTFTVIGVLVLASVRTGIGFYPVWPSLAFALYGGAWTMMGVVRRKLPVIGVAAGCLLTALACAYLTGLNEQWLVVGIGLLLFLAAPGAAMMRKPTAAQELS